MGVKLWIFLNKHLKSCDHLFQFKKMYKEKIIKLYESC